MYIYDNMSLNYYYYYYYHKENVLEKFVEKIGTHYYGQDIFSLKSCIYEIVSKNMVEPDRPRMAVRNTAQGFCMLDN